MCSVSDVCFRWSFLCQEDEIGGLRDNAGPLPEEVRGEDGGPALHPCPPGGSVLVRSYPCCSGYVDIPGQSQYYMYADNPVVHSPRYIDIPGHLQHSGV